MSKDNKELESSWYRLQLVDDHSHKNLWVTRFNKLGLFTIIVTIVCIILGCGFCLVAYTPLKNLVPGYPGVDAQKAATIHSMKIDSLERIVARWTFYSENIKRVIEGEDPVLIDSIIKKVSADSISLADADILHKQDSVLRKSVVDAEQFVLSGEGERALPIEGVHFFTPLRGVVSQDYDSAIHPYIDITAPDGSVVMAVLDGTVVYVGWSDEGGYVIAVQHSNDLLSIYKHNQKVLRKVGDKVTAGASIALVGNTGSLSTGEHLHFELWYKGVAVNPTKYIKF